MLESAYEKCLGQEFRLNEVGFEAQVALPLCYKGVTLDCGYRADMVVEDRLILELKAVEGVKAIHKAQLLSYMRQSGIQTGLLINFNVRMLKKGVQRFRL